MHPSGKDSSILKLAVVALSALTAMPAQAGMMSDMMGMQRPNMKWGLLEFHPYFKISETYDSNIYLVPRLDVSKPQVGGGLVGAWITAPLGGIRLALPISAMHKLEGGYEAEGRLFSKQPRANNAAHQKADLAYGFKGPMGISAKVRDSFINTTDPAFSELIERQQRWQNTAGLDVGYAPEGGRLAVTADVAHGVHKYLDPTLSGLLNRYEQIAGVKGSYKVLPKTKVYIAYHRGITHYSAGRNANHKDHYADVGVEGDLAPKVKGQVQAGLVNRRYDQTFAAGQNRSNNSYTVATKVSWKPLERSMVNLGAARSLQESTFAGNRFYENNLVSLGLMHKLPYKLTAGVNFSAGWDKYPVPSSPAPGVSVANRRDDQHQQAATLDYDVNSWLKAGVGYLHRTRWAKNFTDQFSYEDHQTNLNIAVTF